MWITDVIDDILFPPEPVPSLYWQEVVIRLGMWMQHSASDATRRAAVMAGVVGYLHDKCGPISADLLPSDLQIFLLRNLSLDEIRNAYVCLKGEVIMFPNSIEHVMPQSSAKEHEIPKCDLNFPILTDLDAVIETVAIFLWYKPVTSDARYTPMRLIPAQS